MFWVQFSSGQRGQFLVHHGCSSEPLGPHSPRFTTEVYFGIFYAYFGFYKCISANDSVFRFFEVPEKVFHRFYSDEHRAPKRRIVSRVYDKTVQTVAQLATEMWNISCATLVAWLREILPGCYFREPSWQLQEKCQGLSLWVKGQIRRKNTKKNK